MSRSQYKIYDTTYPYFMTSSCIEGITLFSDPDAAQILLESLLFLQEERGVTLCLRSHVESLSYRCSGRRFII